MGVDLVRPLRRSQGANPARAATQAGPRPHGIRLNAALAVGLWMLLWAGYNTGLWFVEDPHFPANSLQLIHGLRAFVPLVGAWIAILLMLFGTLGAHRFFVGRIRSGILYFLTFGFLGAGVVLDGIMLLCGEFRDAEGNVV
jgi:hypothetical protein